MSNSLCFRITRRVIPKTWAKIYSRPTRSKIGALSQRVLVLNTMPEIYKRLDDCGKIPDGSTFQVTHEELTELEEYMKHLEGHPKEVVRTIESLFHFDDNKKALALNLIWQTDQENLIRMEGYVSKDASRNTSWGFYFTSKVLNWLKGRGVSVNICQQRRINLEVI